MGEWRNVPGTEGKYQINIDTKTGKCRSLNYKGHKGLIRELTSRPDEKNYNRIYWSLAINGKQTCQQAARWIAITFPELVQNEYFEGAQIDHIDGDTLNNHPSNLRWCTPKENMNNPHTIKNLKKGHSGIYPTEETKKKQRLASPKNKPICKKDKDNNILEIYPSIREAARQTGYSSGNICLCCKGVYSTIGGWKWSYL